MYVTSWWYAIWLCCTGSMAPMVCTGSRAAKRSLSSAKSLSAISDDCGGCTGTLPRFDTTSAGPYGR
jgi:hypothetical protein